MADRCTDCTERPVVRCGRCASARCAAHAFAPGERCGTCEADYADDAPTRRSAKLLFAPPLAVLVGGVLFGLMLPITVGGAIGAAIMCALACSATIGAGFGACKMVDRSARALFLRERAVGLPPARLLPARHR
jgi:hypothetical protein